MQPRTFTLNFIGDVMLGRLIDQLLPPPATTKTPHNPNATTDPDTFKKASNLISSYPALKSYSYSSPWGTTLPLLQRDSEMNLNLLNLETAVTDSSTRWPDKAFNFRMHPVNIPVLLEGGADYVNLANNHVLDFGVTGLRDTLRAVGSVGVEYSGVAIEKGQEVLPAALHLPRSAAGGGKDGYTVHVYSASDHPREWGSVSDVGFHLIDYSASTRKRLRTLLSPNHTATSDTNNKTEKPALRIFSIHWGPNYIWHPHGKIKSLAHFLVDECGIDIVHGHSAHHVQGVEARNGKLILYGCGDFVDDYRLNKEFRNDLSAVWRVSVRESPGGVAGAGGQLKLEKLEIFPTRVQGFGAILLGKEDKDHKWVREKVTELSREMETVVRGELGDEGQLIVDL